MMLDIAGQQDLAKLLDSDTSLATKLALVLDQHSIISITDVAGRITFVNNKFCVISGYSAPELLGQNHRILKSDYHPGSFYKDIWNTISQGHTWQGVICNKRKDGNLYWVESTIVPILDVNGKPCQYISARTDITDSTLNKDRFARSQQFANIGTWDWNIQNGDLYWSEQIPSLFGYQTDIPQTTYENFLAAIHPDDRPLVTTAINNCVENGADYNIEHRVIWQDGSIHWLHETGDIVRNEQGQALHMLGVVRDVTRRKKAQLARQESERRLTEAQKIAHMGNWSWDLATGKLFWSDEIYRIFGYQPGEFEPTYERFLASVHPDDIKRFKRSKKLAFSIGSTHSIDHRIILPDGSVRWVHEETEAELDDNDDPVFLQGVIHDITQRHYEEQVQKGRTLILEEIVLDKPLEGILTTMIQYAEEMQPGMKGAILLLDETGHYLNVGAAPSLPDFYNQAVDGSEIGPEAGSCGAAAYSGERRIANDIDKHPHWKALRNLAREAGVGSCWSEPILSSNGDVLGTFAMYHPTAKEADDESMQLAVELSQYASIAIEQIKSRENLLKAKEEAEQANRAKSEFLSSMSHELRTPLNAIIGFSQLMQMSDDSFNEHHAESINEIHQAGKHLLDLINDILDLARIEAGKLNLSIENVIIGNTLIECLQMITSLAEARNIRIKLELNNRHLDLQALAQSDLQVKADRVRLKQVLLNLLSNAVKYNSDNGAITVACKLIDNTRLGIYITDTGKGLNSKQQNELFKPFNRLGAENTNIEGSGIGLVITKNIIEKMNGQIGFESVPDTGSTFWIELPLVSSTINKTINEDEDHMNILKNSSETSHKILYIEDNPSNVRLVSQLLKHRPQIELVDTNEPVSGIQMASTEKPDLILLDINLPGMNGFDVLKELKKNESTMNIPVFAVSANAMAQDIEKGETAGFDKYITKPIDTVAFLKTIDATFK